MRRLRYWLECLRYHLRDPWDDVDGSWAARIKQERDRVSR